MVLIHSRFKNDISTKLDGDMPMLNVKPDKATYGQLMREVMNGNIEAVAANGCALLSNRKVGGGDAFTGQDVAAVTGKSIEELAAEDPAFRGIVGTSTLHDGPYLYRDGFCNWANGYNGDDSWGAPRVSPEWPIYGGGE